MSFFIPGNMSLKLKLLVLLLLSANSINVFSQLDSNLVSERYYELTYYSQEKMDSLANVLETKNISTLEKIKILNELSLFYRFSNPNLALEFLKRALEYSKNIKSDVYISSVYTNAGNIYFDRGDYESSIVHYSIALDISDELSDRINISHSLLDIGYVYHNQGIYDLALKNYQKAAKAAMLVNDSYSLALAYINIGQTFLKLKKYDLAMEHFNKAIEIREETLKDSTLLIHGKTYIGLTLSAQKKYDEALEIFHTCLDFFERNNDLYLNAYTYKYIGDLYLDDGMYPLALRYYNLSLKTFKEYDSRIDIANILLSISRANLYDSKTIEALAYANNALEICEKYYLTNLKKDCLLQLSNIYKSIGELDKSLKLYQEFARLKDSIFSSRFSSKIADLEIQREFLIFEDEIDVIERKNQLEDIAIIFGLISLILILIALTLFYLRYYSQKKANRLLKSKSKELTEVVKELEISQKKFKTLYSKANDAIFLVDEYKFIECNEKTLDIYKCTRDEIIGKSPVEYSPSRQANGKSSAEMAKEYLDLAYSGIPQEFEWVHIQKDGTPFNAEVNLNLITINDKKYIQTIVRDVTLRKKAEVTATKAREIAENATRSKSEFLAKMSHEIRTPLNGLISTIDLLRKEKHSKEQEEMFQMIDSSSKSLMSIVNQILDISKIESGKVKVENNDFNLLQLSQNTFKLFKANAAKKKIDYTLDYDKEIPNVLNGDDNKLKQIISNFLSNSIKFTEKGFVKLQLKKVSQENGEIRIQVKVIDSGIGIPENQKSKIFREYSQSDPSVSRKYGGTGLGLNIVGNLVRIMNGEYGFESTKGKGSTFWAIIPFKVSRKSFVPKSISSTSEEKDTDSKKPVILLAEDNPINQKVTMINLRKSGYEVDVSDNGKMALEMFTKKHYDIILMDIQMPEMDGLEATRKIREYERTHPDRKKSRIIALTANVLSNESESCFEAGMDDFIGKPFKPADLQEAIDKESD